MTSAIIGATTQTITATPMPANSSSSTSSSAADPTSGLDLASNFTQFLTLLTTQLQNQDPTSPMDTNQFTQQLVQFAQVEQQLKSNDQLSTLVSLQQTAQSTQALAFVGATVALNGSTAAMTQSQAQWTYSVPKPASATFTVTNSIGQTIYSTTGTVQAGQQNFTWNGIGNNGTQWPDGNYSLSISATDATGATVGVSTEVDGLVQSVDLTKTPPVLTVNGQTYAISQVKSVTAPGLGY